MSIFPFFEDIKQKEDTKKIPKEYNFDLETKKYKGGFVYGLDAIKIWMYKTLMTTRYDYEIYSYDYGHELNKFIGMKYNKNYMDTEIKRYLDECLKNNKYIKEIKNIEIQYLNRSLNVNFTAITDFGEAQMNVHI